MARLILDTGVLINATLGRFWLDTLTDQDDVAVPAIVLTEFLVGVELDPSDAHRVTQRAFLDEIVTVVPVVDYTRKVVPHHVELLAHTRRTGQPRGPIDLIIAATARATDRTLLTTDSRAGFGDLPGLSVQILTN